MISIYTGDDVALTISLLRNGASFAIDPGATVRAALVQGDTITGPVTLSSGASGADWTQSIVTVEIPAATTATAPLGVNKLEIEVDDSGKTTWVVDHVTVLEGRIT